MVAADDGGLRLAGRAMVRRDTRESDNAATKSFQPDATPLLRLGEIASSWAAAQAGARERGSSVSGECRIDLLKSVALS